MDVFIFLGRLGHRYSLYPFKDLGNEPRLRLIPPEFAVAARLPPGVSPLMDLHHPDGRHVLPLFFRAHGRERLVRLFLIPVGDAAQVQCQLVRMAVLNARAQGFPKIDRLLNVKTVAMRAAQPAFAVVDARVAEKRMAVRLFRAPRRVEIILRARPVRRSRPGFAVIQRRRAVGASL